MNAILYIAAFLFPLDNFPIMFGSAYKPISLIFIVLYFALNLPRLFKLTYKKTEVCILVLLIGSIAVTAFRNVEFHYSFVGLNDAMSSLIAGLVIYLSLKIYVQNNSGSEAYIKLFKWIVKGYGLALGIGFLQVVYIYAFTNGLLSSFITLFVERTAFIQAQRVHFTFSEPSYIGLHTNLLLLPAYFILRQTGNLSKSDKLIVFLFIPISIFSLSLRYFLDLTILFLVYTFATLKPKEIVKTVVKFGAIACVIFILIQTVLVQNVFGLTSAHYFRILHMYQDPSKISKDDSVSVRTTYSELGLYAFTDKPWLGYGLGNYYYGFMNHLDKIPPSQFKKGSELYNATTHLSLPQYNMYTRLLSEFGLIGIALFFLAGYFVLSFKGRNFSKMMIVLVASAMLQFDSLAFIQLFFWIAMLQSPFISEMRIEKVRSAKKQAAALPKSVIANPLEGAALGLAKSDARVLQPLKP